jgi:hypothetical protein
VNIRDLIREDEHRMAQERLEGMLLDGLAGEVSEMTNEDWSGIRRDSLVLLRERDVHAG